MLPSVESWSYNASTGTHRIEVAKNAYVQTDGPNPVGQLYRALHWGDYSPRFPVLGPWRKDAETAARDARKLSRDFTKKTEV